MEELLFNSRASSSMTASTEKEMLVYSRIGIFFSALGTRRSLWDCHISANDGELTSKTPLFSCTVGVG
jgi:hypothetical protein